MKVFVMKNVKLKNYFIFSIFKSKYCWLSLFFGLIIGYYIVPDKIFNSSWFIVGLIYSIVFAVVISCTIRIIKERAVNIKNTGAGFLSVLAAIFGIGAMQVCGVGAPICGATIGFSVFSILVPGIPLEILTEFALQIIIASIGLQLLSLYYMKCFKKI